MIFIEFNWEKLQNRITDWESVATVHRAS